MIKTSTRLATTLCLSLILNIPAWSKSSEREIQANLDGLLWNFPAAMLSLRWNEVPVAEIDEKLANIYRERETEPLWVTADGPSKRAQVLIRILQTADSEGLDPTDYPVAVIEQLWEESSPDALALLDIALTSGLIAYANDLSHGRLRVREGDPRLFAAAHSVEFEPRLLAEQALAASNLENYIEGLAPDYPQYRKLRAVLKQYRQVHMEGGWQKIPEGPTLHPGEEDGRVPLIRERLLLSGDLSDNVGVAGSLLYNESLVEAVEKFQQRHGLTVDGVVGRGTLSELNVTTADRIRQIELNMERWRWSDIDLGEDFVLVDIAGFRLYKVHDGELVLQMPVIVGKQYHQTPVFSDSIKYIEFNPYWNVPPSIARNEELPKLRKNPGHLAAQHIRLFSSWGEGARELDPQAIDWNAVSKSQMGRFKLRQDPGPWNALGTMKFVFPNKHSVYLHDTPSRNLFGRETRALSHGCVRVGNPSGLALNLLGDETQGWDSEQIEKVVESGRRQIVKLPKPVPVHITYQTAWVNGDGWLVFSRDIYDRDARLVSALYGGSIIEGDIAGQPLTSPKTAVKSEPKPEPKPTVVVSPVSTSSSQPVSRGDTVPVTTVPIITPPAARVSAQPDKKQTPVGFHAEPDTR